MKLKCYEGKCLHKLLTHSLIRCRRVSESLGSGQGTEQRCQPWADAELTGPAHTQHNLGAKQKETDLLTAFVFHSLQTLLSRHRSLKLPSPPCLFCLSLWTSRLSHSHITPGKADLRCKHQVTMHITHAHTVGDDKPVLQCACAQESRENFPFTSPLYWPTQARQKMRLISQRLAAASHKEEAGPCLMSVRDSARVSRQACLGEILYIHWHFQMMCSTTAFLWLWERLGGSWRPLSS